MTGIARTGSRAYRFTGLSLLLVAAFTMAVLMLTLGGGAEGTRLLDPGPFVRWALPMSRLLNSIAAAAMLGSLVLTLFALRAGDRRFDVGLDTASVGAAVFTVTSALGGFFTFLVSFPIEVSADRQFGEQFGAYLALPLGATWLITTLIGAVVTIFAFAWRTWTPTLFTTMLAGAALLPLATQGHAGGQLGHATAVNSILLHTAGAAVWLGGLILLMLLRGTANADIIRRYSSIALAAFVLVAVSGLVRSTVALGDVGALFTPYGAIVIVKTVLLIVLGAFGVWYRTRLIPRIDTERGRGAFWMLVLGEVTIMGLASGAATALGRTRPPTGDEVVFSPTPAQRLTTSPLPPELTLERWVTAWSLDILWLVVAGFLIFFYVAGVRRLRARGDSWPIYRTICWIAGNLMLVWVTSGSINAYGDYLFSVHMLGHMLLSMAIPLLLVSGAPVTLALRAIRRRDDGTRGGREWILWAVRSPASKVLTHPVVAAALFILSLWAFYYTDLVRWSLYDHLGHQWMIVHFLITGYLFVLSIAGADPVPYRMPYAGRLLTLIAVMAIHAFFGIAIMMQNGLMVAEWFGSMGRTWGPTPMEDQYNGGGIAWSVGELPTLILAIMVAVQWSRSDERQQRRFDRHADRTDDAELAEYNAHLAALAAQDGRRG